MATTYRTIDGFCPIFKSVGPLQSGGYFAGPLETGFEIKGLIFLCRETKTFTWYRLIQNVHI
jgi:esterase/lipase